MEDDNTPVIRRLSDIDSYLARQSRNRNLLSSDRSDQTITKQLFFHDSSMDRTALGTSPARPGVKSSSRPTIPEERERHMATVLKRQREADLIVANGQITDLNVKLSSQETILKRTKLDYEAQTKELKLLLQLAKKKEDDAQEQLFTVCEREAECRKQLAELRAEFESSKFSYEKKLCNLEKETFGLKTSMEAQISQLQEEMFELKNELEREVAESIELQTELETCQDSSELRTKQLEELKLKVEESAADNGEKSVLQEKIEGLEKKLSNIEDATELVPILNGEIARLKICGKENVELREENRILRLRDENIHLLKEELDGCKKISEARAVECSDVHRLKLECEELRRQLGSWDALAQICAEKEPSGFKSKAVSREIARLQQQETTLLQKVGQLTTECQNLSKTAHELEEELAKAKEVERRSGISIKQTSDNVRHLRRKLLLVAKERDMSRMLLDNYEKETTIVAAQQDDGRLQRMESILEGYKRDIETLETELRIAQEHLRSIGHHQGSEVAEERNRLEAKIKLLEKQNGDLELLTNQYKEEKHIAEMKLASASVQEGVTSDLRRIHLMSNPVQWKRDKRERQFASVTKENEALRQRVQVLEEAEGRVADLTLQVEERLKEAPSEKDIKALQTKLTTSENKNARQFDLFTKLSKEFREATCNLLGYNISQPVTDQFRLSNIYANSSEEYFLFSKNESGELQLLDTPYSRAHGENIDLYLHTHCSIPAFLSNITLELFKVQSSSLAETTK